MTEQTAAQVAAQIAETGYHLPTQACLGCGPEEPVDPTCGYCEGTGTMRHVPWATEAWSEIIPGLWVGGHEYQPDRLPIRKWTYPRDLDAAGFDVVVSLFRPNPEFGLGPVCIPAPPTQHIEVLIQDDPFAMRNPYAIEWVWGAAVKVADSVEDGKDVLVRCHAGMNRSALVAALAMVRMGYQPQAAIDEIRRKRTRFALFNASFVDLILAQKANPEGRYYQEPTDD